ncbi:MAG: glycosyltransferase [candidate division Zixibacteria bacterium]|nr:glycosyltransferase [candidate division Zixibacteria bacterium]
MAEATGMEIAFWVLALLMLYTLAGYPVVLRFLASFKKEPSFEATTARPPVSFIVAAYNEEKNIAAKLDNLRRIEYPADKVEFIIGSDGSTDATDQMVTRAAETDKRIRFFRLDKRGGKIAVLHRAAEMASGEILIFTDCSVRTDPDIVPKILACFEDPKVGLVSSRDVWVDEREGTPLGQRDYIDYEMTIRRLESRLNSLVSASGSFFAVRKELFRPYGSDLADDFALPLQVYRQGYRVIHRDDLIGYVPMVASSGAELSRRTRIIQAGIRTVIADAALLNPLRYPIFAWQLWSHKALKWLFPFMVIASIIMAIALWAHSPVYKIIVGLYALTAVLALLGFAVKGQNVLSKPFRTANFFLLSMIAVVIAWYRVLTGRKTQTWEPSHR